MNPLLFLFCLPPVLWMWSDSPAPTAAHSRASDGAWDIRSETWRSDPAWYDGRAEMATYRASRTIYGIAREYRAVAYTNKQVMDRRTTTKAEVTLDSGSSDRVEVFKHHWSERIETEAYDYDFSTAVFLDTDDLELFKLTVGTQEDCGASFKQVWREGRRFAAFESVYFPGAGMREETLRDTDLVFEDALPLLLRDFPFDSRAAVSIRLVRSQKSTKRVSFDPVDRLLVARGEEVLDLPIGRLPARRVDLLVPASRVVEASYWLASAGDAPTLHALARYDGPGGVSYLLESLERTAYWER